MIYPTTLSSALRTSPNLSSPLYRRWFPGAGQRGGGFAGFAEAGYRSGFSGMGLYAGFSGLGQTCSDGTEPYEGDAGLECDDGSSPGSYVVPVATPNPTVLTPTTPVALVPSPISTAPLTLTPSTTVAPLVAPGGLCPDGSTPFSDGTCAETSAPAGS